MASPAVSGWPYSPTMSTHHAARSPSISLKDGNNTNNTSLHSALSNLTLSSSNANGHGHAGSFLGSSSGEDTAVNGQGHRPLPMRTPSGGSLTRAVAAIGSGRAGTSPPSRLGLSPNDIGNLPLPAKQTSNNTVPWPTSTSTSSSSSTLNNPSSAQATTTHNNHPNNRADGHPRPSHHAPHSDLPGLSGEHADGSSSRFALSQPQFNLDHAQLAKSREQRDLDDVDSGQRASATLWMGDLEGWMDETYIRRCISALGWDRDENGNQTIQTNVKMIKGASSTSGYCFITFPTSAHAQSVLSHFSKQPPMLMPGSERTFKLNWATGLPGVQPKWEGEYSVFVGDLGREVTEGELVALFTPLFPSTKSAKIMYDPATGLSRGYGFVRFGDETDMTRSLALGQNTSGSGLSLRGRTLRISEASGSGGSRNRTQSGDTSTGGSSSLLDVNNNGMPNGSAKNHRDLHIQVPGGGGGSGGGDMKSPYGNNAASYTDRHPGNSPNLLSPNATGFSIPVALPASPSTPSYSSGPATSPLSPSADPNNTTVFVGGLPALISEDTLKSFFQHFGEITYVKIPPNKGCGFVQFVRRADAELAIAKMHDFPIHGKSRIRLSWGRSQGDKQVEHVRKLANALNVPFEAVWRMVQGQDNSTIKQIASAVGSHGPRNGGQAGLPAPAGGSTRGQPDPESARAEIARLVGFGGEGTFPSHQQAQLPQHQHQQRGGGMFDSVGPSSGMPAQPHVPGPHDPEHYAFRPAVPQALSPENFGWAGPPRDNGPYSRVSPSAFAPMSTSNLSGHPQTTVPLSPPPSAGVYQQHSLGAAAGAAYTAYTPVQLSTPSNLGALSPAVAEAAGAPFDPRQWRLSATPRDSTASGGMHDFLGAMDQ